ncbi:MAG TPA: hypothetical protein VJL81_11250 [Solirubrobacterales bacterium]|nr:hypothetical protein [Solirubrobacterales bacterium]
MRRIALLLLAALAALSAPTIAQASHARTETAVFARGTSPQGERWSASADVRPNRRRRLWRFDVEFRFSNGYRWGSGQEIPIGSHEQMAREADGYTGLLSEGAPESAAFGYAGSEVTRIKMKMSDGSSLEVHPVFPPERLRHKFVWMRGFRYFMQYYSGGAYVTEYWLYDRAGLQVGCDTYAEGELLGPSICGTRPIT